VRIAGFGTNGSEALTWRYSIILVGGFDNLTGVGLTQTIAEKSDSTVGAIHELPLPRVVLRKSYGVIFQPR
jgi:hypothetical protein